MKIQILTIIFIIITSLSYGQKQIPSFDLVIAFKSSLGLSIEAELSKQKLIKSNNAFAQLIDEYNFNLIYEYSFSEDELARMEKEALRISNSKQGIENLKSTYRIEAKQLSETDLLILKQKLEALDIVRYCEKVSNIPLPPPYDIAPTTPNYEPLQKYLDPNPGVNMRYAWDRGITGEGIRIRNVEYGFNKNHEEFNDNDRVFINPGYNVHQSLSEDYTEHGTGTFGALFGNNGEYGVTGMVYGADELVLFPEYTQEYYYNRRKAVSLAINSSQEGDVIIFEMQTGGVNESEDDPHYVPAEYSFPIWDLTKAASDLGIIIVAAAGNGNQNLDAPEYEEYMQRGNSGAIIVGAGRATTTHSKLSFSTYGSRVNLQGWGEKVLSSGYGDYAIIGNDFNQQYTQFSGTSSATPIVAACVVALQSYYYEITNTFLDAQSMITLLQETGYPQSTGGNIGPFPNMKAAIEAMDLQLSKIQTNQQLKVNVYPNPSTQLFYINGISGTTNLDISISDLLGKNVDFSFNKHNQTINLSSSKSGVYILTIKTDNNIFTTKIFKQ